MYELINLSFSICVELLNLYEIVLILDKMYIYFKCIDFPVSLYCFFPLSDFPALTAE